MTILYRVASLIALLWLVPAAPCMAQDYPSPPDGYTLLMISATQTTTETLVPNKPFKLLRDFVPVAALLNSELVMVVRPSVPVNTVKEFIVLAKSKSGALNYASSGVGSNYHM